MIIKGKPRSGPVALAKHLGNAEKNERVTLIETKGVVASDLRGALVEMDAYAAGTKAEKPLYHAAISPEPPHRLSPEQRAEAINALEAQLGLRGHSRVVVMHEKLGREHIHVVWSRIDLERMRAVSDSHNYRKHEEVARDLERRFGHERVQGAHHERDGVKRPERTPSRAELRQEERTGIKGKAVREEVTALFKDSNSAVGFKDALVERGYVLARGDKRDFVIVDKAGGIHSLARRIADVKAAELRHYMEGLDKTVLPDVERAKRIAEERRKQSFEREQAKKRARLEKGYAGGDDYVTQATAAQRDFEKRQSELNKKQNNAVRMFDYGETNAERAKKERQAKLDRNESEAQQHRDEEVRKQQAAKASGDTKSELPEVKGEMSDEKQRRMERLMRASRRDDERDGDRDPDRQPRAPGGGRTRSR